MHISAEVIENKWDNWKVLVNSTLRGKLWYHSLVILFQFNDQLESARELETNQAQLRGQIQEAQKHVSSMWSARALYSSSINGEL